MCAIKRLSLLFIVTIFVISCSSGGGDGNGTGSGGDDCTRPALVGYGFADSYILRMNGAVENIPAPLVYYVDHLREGSYLCQVQAVWNEQPDYPLDFWLHVWNDGYEVEPLNWPDNFDNLILEIQDG